MSVEEFENMFWLFAVAGNETLRNGIPGGMIALLAHPPRSRRCARIRRCCRTAVDEMLRWWTPVMVFRRTAVQDVSLGGVSIAGRGQGGGVVRRGQPRSFGVRPIRPYSTSGAARIRTSSSGMARTSAWARSWLVRRCGRCSGNCFPVRRGSKRPGRLLSCSRTFSAGSRRCRSVGSSDPRREGGQPGIEGIAVAGEAAHAGIDAIAHRDEFGAQLVAHLRAR